MTFCTKCGDRIEKDWKHCPSCGQVVAKKTLSAKKLSGSPKPIVLAKDATPIINGVPPQSIRKNLSQDKSLNLNDKNPDKKFLSLVGVFVFFIVVIILGIGVSKNNSNSAELARQQLKVEEKEAEIAQAFAEEIKTDKGKVLYSAPAFRVSNCKPKFYKSDDWEMKLDRVVGIEEFPTKYAFNSDRKIEWESMGNSVDRTLVVIAAYELKLSELYWDIFDIYKEKDRMGGYKSEWNQYFNFLDKMASKLCYQDEPSPQQLVLAEESMNSISTAWRLGFESWHRLATEASRDISQEISDYVKDLTTPKCTETKTNIPGYNIIKCTNLP